MSLGFKDAPSSAFLPRVVEDEPAGVFAAFRRRITKKARMAPRMIRTATTPPMMAPVLEEDFEVVEESEDWVGVPIGISRRCVRRRFVEISIICMLFVLVPSANLMGRWWRSQLMCLLLSQL